MTPPVIIYLAGHARTGSTIIDASVARLNAVASLGELSHLPTFLLRELPCTCGEPINGCPQWSHVVEVAARYDLRAIETLTRDVEQSLLPRRTAKPTDTYLDFWTQVLLAAQQDRQSTYLIDASKSLVQFRRRCAALRQGGFDIRILHTTRDTQGVVRSSRSGPGDVLGERWKASFAGPRALLGLTLSNAQARLDKHAAEHSTNVDLDNFVADPDTTVGRCARELSIQTTPDLGPLLTGHAIGGNRHRHSGATRLEVVRERRLEEFG